MVSRFRYFASVRSDRLLERILSGDLQNVRFSDLLRLAENLGFALDRRSASHHILYHPKFGEQLNLQEVRGEAKPYQVRQFRRLVVRYNLKIGRRT